MSRSQIEQLVFDEAVRLLVKNHGYTRTDAVKLMNEHPESITKGLQENLTKRMSKKVLD